MLIKTIFLTNLLKILEIKLHLIIIYHQLNYFHNKFDKYFSKDVK